ncbi:MAG TPA: hypothetical protein PLF35_15495, partial [Prolixibacteraceae bacterium]|nr:hypothetical protein [Prolixibacteraceae bacterium]
MYRENKTENIPLYEGEITQSNIPTQNQYNNITVVALGTTSLENDSTYVTFNKLLSTNNNNESYYILAIP